MCLARHGGQMAQTDETILNHSGTSKAWIAALRETIQIGMLHVNYIAGSRC
jgi:hypothetical protein